MRASKRAGVAEGSSLLRSPISTSNKAPHHKGPPKAAHGKGSPQVPNSTNSSKPKQTSAPKHAARNELKIGNERGQQKHHHKKQHKKGGDSMLQSLTAFFAASSSPSSSSSSAALPQYVQVRTDIPKSEVEMLDRRAVLLSVVKVDTNEDTALVSDSNFRSYNTTKPQKHQQQLLLQQQQQQKVQHLQQTENSFRKEAWAQLSLALPMILNLSLEFLPVSISIAFIGKYTDSLALASASHATRISGIVGQSIGLGFLGALDTLGSQSHGAGNSKMIGFQLQQGTVIMTLFMIPVTILSFQCENLLLLLGQPADVAELSQPFAIVLIPGVAITFIYELLRRALQPFEVTAPFTAGAVAQLIGTVASTWWLLVHMESGYMGAAWGRLIGQVLMIVSSLIYLAFTKSHRLFWDGWKVQALNVWQWGEWFRIGVPGILQLVLEWWFFEYWVLMAGWLPDAEVSIAAASILLQVVSSTFMAYMGLANACGVRTGVLLGAGNSEGTRLAIKVGLMLEVLLAALLASTLYAVRNELVWLFTSTEVVQKLCVEAFGLCVLLQLSDAMNGMFSAIFRSAGMQGLSAIIQGIAFWLFGVPLCYYLSYNSGMGFMGLMIGVAASVTLACVLDIILMVLKLDCNVLAKKIHMKRSREAVP